MKQKGRRKITPEVIREMKKLRKKDLSNKEIADKLKLSTMTVYNYLKKKEKRWLARVLNRKMIAPIFFVAFFAFLSTFASFQVNTRAKYHKTMAEAARTDWLTYYQIYLNNPEDVDARNMAEQSLDELITHDVAAFKFDFYSRAYQLSIQGSIISLILFLAAFSISKSNTLIAINGLAIAFIGMAVCYFILATLQL